ncbi:unnamed protein product [Polarella glacialis]|nr:unnamed protein product [Polarella glacialis]
MWREVLARLPEVPEYQGQGIVIVTTAKRLPFVIAHLEWLRDEGCELPVELWHLDEIEDWQCRPAEKLNLKCCNLGAPWRGFGLSGFQLIAPSLVMSSFREVIYLTGDSFVLKDPSYLLSSAPFRKHGLILWADLWSTEDAARSPEAFHFASTTLPKHVLWTLFDIEFSSENALHTSSVNSHAVFDKRRRWEELNLLLYFSMDSEKTLFHFWGHSDGIMHGDQSSWKFASLALGRPYHLVDTGLVVGSASLPSLEFFPCAQAFGDPLYPGVPLWLDMNAKQHFWDTMHCYAPKSLSHIYKTGGGCPASMFKISGFPATCVYEAAAWIHHNASRLPSRIIGAALETSQVAVDKLFNERSQPQALHSIKAPDFVDCDSDVFDPSWAHFLSESWEWKKNGRWPSLDPSAIPFFMSSAGRTPQDLEGSVQGFHSLISVGTRAPDSESLGGMCALGEILAAYLMFREEDPEVLLRKLIMTVHDLTLDVAVQDVWPVSLSSMVEEAFQVSAARQQAYVESVRLYTEFLSTEPKASAQARALPSTIAIFCWHAGVSLTLHSSLSSIVGATTRFVFFGQHSPASALPQLSSKGQVDRRGQLAAMHETWMHLHSDSVADWEMHVQSSRDDMIREYRYVLSTLPEQSLLVCSGPAVFCLMLLDLVPSSMWLLTYFMDNFDMIPFQEMHHYQNVFMTAQNTGKASFLAASPFVAASLEFATWVRIPVAHLTCLYAVPQTELFSQALFLRNKLLVAKSALFGTHSRVGRSFLNLLRAFSEASSLDIQISHWETTFDNHVDLQNQLVTDPRGVLYLPDTLSGLLFYELYAMGVPIIAPGRMYLSQIALVFPFYHLNKIHSFTEFDNRTGGFAFTPWQDYGEEGTAGGPHSRMRHLLHKSTDEAKFNSDCHYCRAFLSALCWAGLADVSNWPHVIHFESISALLQELQVADFPEISRNMRTFHEERQFHSHKAFMMALGVLGQTQST